VSIKTYSEKEIAALTGGDLFISANVEISGINSLVEANASDASFLGNEKYYNDFLATKAGLVFAPKILKEAPKGVAIIHVDNPSLAFATLADHIATTNQKVDYQISEHAYISKSAEFPAEQVVIMAGVSIGENVILGKGCILHPGVVISDNVTVGEFTTIYPNCVVRENCQIGSNVILQPGCVIGSDGYGYELTNGKHKKIAQIGIVIIEDEVEIGANSTIDRARFGQTVIGKGTKIDNLVQIAHNVTIGEYNLIVAQSGIAGSTETAEFVTLGAQAGIAGHLKVGKGVVVAGQSGLAKSINTPGYYQGTPARPLEITRKSRALVNRLPKLMDRIKALEEKISKLESL